MTLICKKKGAVAPKTATNPMAEIHAFHGIAAIGL